MRHFLLTAILALPALGPAASRARAEGFPQILGNDPLTKQILAKTSQDNGGVSAAVRVGSGQVVLLNPADIAAAPRAVALAPAALSTAAGIKPAADLARKRVKTKGRPIRRAVDQLKRASAVRKAWNDGR